MAFFAPLLAAGAGAAAGAGVAAAGTGAAAIMGGIGTGLSVFGTLLSGVQAYNQYGYEADVAEQNARAVQVSADFGERRLQREGEQLRSRQIVAAAASGLVPYIGSPLEIQAESWANVLEDINVLRYNRDVQMGQYNAAADFYRMSAPMALGMSILSAGAQTFGGIKNSAQAKIPKPPDNFNPYYQTGSWYQEPIVGVPIR
jgi:hypothetical protein